MTDPKRAIPPAVGEMVVFEAPDGAIRVDVRLDRESVWRPHFFGGTGNPPVTVRRAVRYRAAELLKPTAGNMGGCDDPQSSE